MLMPNTRQAILSVFIAAFIAVLPGSVAGAEAPGTGEQQLINIDVKDAPIDQVLRMLAKAANVNIAIGQDVTGTVEAVALHDVTVDMALRTIARLGGFYWWKDENVYIVSKQPPLQMPAGTPGAMTPAPLAPQPVGPQAVTPMLPAPPVPGPSIAPPGPAPTAEPRLVSTLIMLKHTDAGELAVLFGGTIGDMGIAGGVMPLARPSDLRKGMTRGSRGLPADVFGQGFGTPVGNGGGLGWGGGLNQQFGGGLGGGVGGRGGLGGQQSGIGGRQGGSQGGLGGGSLGNLLPGDMEPPTAYMPQNALLVRGTQEDIDRFQEILDLLDRPAKQVEIATKFIEVQTTADRALGIDWAISNGSLEIFNQGFAPGEAINNVIRWASGNFTAQLNALVSSGRATVINEPHVITMNNQAAEINFFTTIPYFSAQVSFNQFGTREVDFTSDFIDVENSLFVVPRINADDSVTVFLEPTLEDTVGEVEGPNGERIPIVTSQFVSTQVRVGDGETIVLGGLIRKDESVTLRETPLLGRIPIIGKLFQARRNNKRNSELLIFVTPRIVRDIPAM
jgi:general secretion pathway protein D